MTQKFVELTDYRTQSRMFLMPEKIRAIVRVPAVSVPGGTKLDERTKINGENSHEEWLVVETPEEVHAAIAAARPEASDG